MEDFGTLKIYLHVLETRQGEQDVLKGRTRRVTLLTKHCINQAECEAIVSRFLKDNSLENDALHPIEAFWSKSALIYPYQY